jgi:hypothetical protein
VIPSDKDDMDGLITAIAADDELPVPNHRELLLVWSDLLAVVLTLLPV